LIADRRVEGDGSDTLVNVELLDFSTNLFGGAFDLDRFGGPTGLSVEDFQSFIELYIAYFNRAPDAEGLNFWGSAFANGYSLETIATLFLGQSETQQTYPDTLSNLDFATQVYNNVLGRDPELDGFNFWTGQLNAGNVTESSFILDLLAGARAATGSPADVAYIESKTDLGLYFAVIQGQNDLTSANDVMDAFNGSAASLTAAQDLSDASLAVAETGSTDVLMPVVGVIDNPFADIA